MSIELKIKYKTLAAESRIIKNEEQRVRRQARRLTGSKKGVSGTDDEKHLTKRLIKAKFAALTPDQLAARQAKAACFMDEFSKIRLHRMFTVRVEARKTHLARAFLKGVPRSVVETVVRDNNQLNCLGSLMFVDIYKLAARYTDIGDNELQSEFQDWLKS